MAAPSPSPSPTSSSSSSSSSSYVGCFTATPAVVAGGPVTAAQEVASLDECKALCRSTSSSAFGLAYGSRCCPVTGVMLCSCFRSDAIASLPTSSACGSCAKLIGSAPTALAAADFSAFQCGSYNALVPSNTTACTFGISTFTTAASTTSAKTAASSTTSIRSSVSPVPGTAVNGTAATPAAVASSSTSLTIIQIDGIAIGCALAVIGAGLLIYYYFVRPRRRAKEEAANKASGNFVTVNMINSTRDGEVGMMGSTTVDRMEFRNGVPAARPNAGSDQSARASRQYDVAAAAFDSAREAYDSPSRMPAQPSTFQNDLRVPASSLSNTNDPRRPTVSRAYQQQDPRMQSEPSAGYPARRLVSSETVSTVAGGGGVGRERTFNMRDHKSTVHRLWTLTDPSPTPNHPPMPSNLSPAHAAAIAHRSSTRTANSTHTADAAYASFSEKKRPGSAAASSSSWRSWNTQQVAKALADLGMDLTVVDLFLRNEIDGVVLARMDSAFLANELGIAAAGARARVMMMVEVVRGEYGGDATPSNGSVASSESPLLSPPPYLR